MSTGPKNPVEEFRRVTGATMRAISRNPELQVSFAPNQGPSGISGNERRPDILVVSETPSSTSVVLVEAKRSSDGRYISDSVYKAFGYLYDLRDLAFSGVSVAAVLAVPTGVAAAGAATSKRSLYVTSGDDRMDFAASLRAAIDNRI